MIRRGIKLIFISSSPADGEAGFSTQHPNKLGPAATASTGLFPPPFLIRIKIIKELTKTVLKYMNY
jgi:hypothetical protein